MQAFSEALNRKNRKSSFEGFACRDRPWNANDKRITSKQNLLTIKNGKIVVFVQLWC